MKVICILQNAWGSGSLPLLFAPNEGNKSASTIRKKVLQPQDTMLFCNTTAEVTATAAGKAKYNVDHFNKVIQRLHTADVLLVCGNQAKEAVQAPAHYKQIQGLNKPIIYMPHPASRSLSNLQLAEVKKMVEAFRPKTESEVVLSTRDLQAYSYWAFLALLGANPIAADKHLRENMDNIKRIAAALLVRAGITEPLTVHRGVILQNPIKACLLPHPNFTYLSFSLNKGIAQSFADHTDTGFGSVYDLGTHGYLIEYQARPEEILYHPSFRELTPIDLFFHGSVGINTLDEQEEVIVLQPRRPFTNITKYEK